MCFGVFFRCCLLFLICEGFLSEVKNLRGKGSYVSLL